MNVKKELLTDLCIAWIIIAIHIGAGFHVANCLAGGFVGLTYLNLLLIYRIRF